MTVPAFNTDTKAVWSASKVISPSPPGTVTDTTSPSKTGPSTLEIVSFSSFCVAMFFIYFAFLYLGSIHESLQEVVRYAAARIF